MTRIVYVAPFVHEWGTESYLAADAEKIPGVTVDRVPEPQRCDAHWWIELIERCEGADLLLYTKGQGLGKWEDYGPWRAIECGGTQTASFHLDRYVGLRRERELDTDPFWRTGTVFTADGDPHSAEVFRARGINHRWLPPAVSSDAPLGRWMPDIPPVAFVGAYAYHDEWPWRPGLLDGLKARYGDRFHRWGNAGRIHGDELSAVYRSAVVNVGDSLCPPGTSRYCSDRLPECLGRGGFLIFPRIEGIADYYGLVDGVHCRFYEYGDLDGVFALVDDFLAHPDEARTIADRGCAQIRAHHTYVDRAREILTVLGLV